MELEMLKGVIKNRYVGNAYSSLDERIKSELTDRQAAEHGPVTTEISKFISGRSNAQVKHFLDKYHKKGMLIKYKKGMVCRWWYDGLIDELKGE